MIFAILWCVFSCVVGVLHKSSVVFHKLMLVLPLSLMIYSLIILDGVIFGANAFVFFMILSNLKSQIRDEKMMDDLKKCVEKHLKRYENDK